jgi:hypothetical protein
MHTFGFITQLVLVILARNCAASTAAATASDGQPAAAGNLLQLGQQAGLRAQQPTRRLQESIIAAADLQQTLQRMLAVPLATPQSVLAPGYSGLEAGLPRQPAQLAPAGTQAQHTRCKCHNRCVWRFSDSRLHEIQRSMEKLRRKLGGAAGQ